MDFNTARFNMIQQQIRTWDVSHPPILELFSIIPREQFVPSKYRALAFSDSFIPIGHNQVILPPKMVGRMLQSLNLTNTDHVLEIGTGTGYMTALLSKLVKKVVTIEIIPELAKQAVSNLQTLGLYNVNLEIGNAISGWPNEKYYDAIILTGSVPALSKNIREQLAINGRMFAVVGEAPIMSAILITRISKDHWQEENLFETELPPLIHAPQIEHFKF